MIKEAFLTIGTINFDKLVSFYQVLLQQNPNPYLLNRYAEFRLSGLKLGIFNPNFNQKQEFSQPQGSGFSLCLEVEQLELVISSLQNRGYPSSGQIIEASHGREIYLYDPDGNRLILHQSPFSLRSQKTEEL